jgi:hypothetical protein
MTENDIYTTFQRFEEFAEHGNVPVIGLSQILAVLLQEFSYQPEVCELDISNVFRARTFSASTLKEACFEFKNQKDLGCPPDRVSGQGRCNEKVHAVFYCSTDNGVTIFETRPEVGQFVVVGQYKKIGTNRVNIPIIGAQQIKQALVRRNPKDPLVSILGSLPYFSSNVDRNLLELDIALSQWFTRKVDESNKQVYKLTTAFYEIFAKQIAYFDDHEYVESLIYPSVESEVSGFNIVMERNFVKRNYDLASAIIYKLEIKDGKTYILRPLKSLADIRPRGTLIWENFYDSDVIWKLSPSSPSFFHNGDGSF